MGLKTITKVDPLVTDSFTKAGPLVSNSSQYARLLTAESDLLGRVWMEGISGRGPCGFKASLDIGAGGPEVPKAHCSIGLDSPKRFQGKSGYRS